jgi:hypothetical protein
MYVLNHLNVAPFSSQISERGITNVSFFRFLPMCLAKLLSFLVGLWSNTVGEMSKFNMVVGLPVLLLGLHSSKTAFLDH